MKKKIMSLLILSSTILATQTPTIEENIGKSPEEFRLYREQLHYGKNQIVLSSVRVVGNAIVDLKPEFVTLSFLLNMNNKGSTFGLERNASKEKIAEEMNRYLKEFNDYLLSIGVKEDNISVTKYDSSSKRATVADNAEVIHSIQVTFDVSTDLGAVLKKIEPSPIQNIGEVLYSVSDKTKYEGFLKAQKLALENARDQIMTIAQVNNCKVGDIRAVNLFPAETQSQGNNDYYKEPSKGVSYSKPEIKTSSTLTNGVIRVTSSVECLYDLINEVPQ